MFGCCRRASATASCLNRSIVSSDAWPGTRSVLSATTRFKPSWNALWTTPQAPMPSGSRIWYPRTATTGTAPGAAGALCWWTDPETTVSRSVGRGNVRPGTLLAVFHCTPSGLTLSVGRSRPAAARSRNSSADSGPSTRPSASMYQCSTMHAGLVPGPGLSAFWATLLVHTGGRPIWTTVAVRKSGLVSLLGIQLIQLREERLDRRSVGGRLADEREHRVAPLVEDVGRWLRQVAANTEGI